MAISYGSLTLSSSSYGSYLFITISKRQCYKRYCTVMRLFYGVQWRRDSTKERILPALVSKVYFFHSACNCCHTTTCLRRRKLFLCGKDFRAVKYFWRAFQILRGFITVVMCDRQGYRQVKQFKTIKHDFVQNKCISISENCSTRWNFEEYVLFIWQNAWLLVKTRDAQISTGYYFSGNRQTDIMHAFLILHFPFVVERLGQLW